MSGETQKKKLLEIIYIFWFHWRKLRTEELHTVAQFVAALRYKPEGRGFDSRWFHWNFSLM
jgi:hypothetical protein